MRWKPNWDLTTIPDDALKGEWARRNAAKAAAKRARTDVDTQTRAYLDKKAKSMRKLRAERKKNEL